MDENLLIPGLLTFLDLVHDVDRLAHDRGNDLHAEQVLQDYFGKVWRGVPGLTPSRGDTPPHLDAAILQWVQAVGEFLLNDRAQLR